MWSCVGNKFFDRKTIAPLKNSRVSFFLSLNQTFCLQLLLRVCRFNERLINQIRSSRHATYIQCDQIWRNFATLAQHLKNFGHFDRVHFVFGNILSLLWLILNSSGQILNVENGQILNKQSSHLVTLTNTTAAANAKAFLISNVKLRNNSIEFGFSATECCCCTQKKPKM